MTAAQVEAYVRALAREELGMEPTDAEVARGCAAIASCVLDAAMLDIKPPPDFDPHAPIEDLPAHFAEASAVMRERLVGK